MQQGERRWQSWRVRWRNRWQSAGRLPGSLRWVGRWIAPVGLGMLAGAALVVVAALFLINTGLPPLGNALLPGTAPASLVAPAMEPSTETGQTATEKGKSPVAELTTTQASKPAAGTVVESADRPASHTDTGSNSGTPDTMARPQPARSWPWPVRGEVQRAYGWFRHPVYDDWRLHAGIDIGVAAGVAVKASLAGKVERVYNDPLESLTIQVLSPSDVRLVYGGLSQALVQVGDSVNAGQTLGRAGAAVDPQGRHYVHFAVKMGDSPVDPIPYLQPPD
ncbi:MAG: M23 family metallopeptidase [Limnochordaceae bacterium]|nr:M23 family metallopeptidase [Limnochordaceae bacterium]